MRFGFALLSWLAVVAVPAWSQSPPNDSWERAMPMEWAVQPWSAVGATQDGQSACDVGTAPDVWFVYTPEVSATVSFRTTTELGWDATLSLHTFDANGDLEILACDDDGAAPLGESYLVWNVEGARPYYLRVAGKNGTTGRFDLLLNSPPPHPFVPFAVQPPNASRETALPIRPGQYPGYTRGKPGPLGGCFQFTEDAWFTYTPTASGVAFFSSCGSPWTVSDATVSVEANGSLVLCGLCDLGGGGGINVNAGTEYLIRVGTSGGASGSFTLNLSGPPTAGDTCADAEPIDEGHHLMTLVGSAASGTSSCSSSDPDHFFRYVAPTDGILDVSTCATTSAAVAGYAVDTALTLYSGCPADVAHELDCSKASRACEGGFRPQPYVSTPVTQGQAILIRVSARAEGQLGPIRLDLELAPFLAVCFGDGSGTPCPCGNAGAPQRGCDNSLATGGARLYASGTAALVGDALTLVSTDAPPSASILLLQGDQAQNSGAGAPFADGLLCVAGEMRRLVGAISTDGARVFGAQAGQSLSALGGVTVPGTRWYQGYYRNVGSFCTGAPANLTNAVRVTWTLLP